MHIDGSPLHLIGLDSAWLAGDDDDAGKLHVTQEQVGRLLTANGEPLPGAKIALIHHPLGELSDGQHVRRLLAEYGVGLLLHGHLHDPEIERWTTPISSLHVSAAGCLYESDRYPNSLQLLDFDRVRGGDGDEQIEPAQIWARAWSSRGHWHDDDGLYPGSHAGRLGLKAARALTPPPVGGHFVGRQDELGQLVKALMPPDPGAARKPAVVCCAIEGMPGVGKTRLAEQFVQEHWLPRFSGTARASDADLVLRLVLDPQSAVHTDAQQLGRQIADRLQALTLTKPDPFSLTRLGPSEAQVAVVCAASGEG